MTWKELLLLTAPGLPVLAAAASGGRAPGDPLDAVAEEYVRLVLAVGRHDPRYVDAFYGPPAWREEAARGLPAPPERLRDVARCLRERVRALPPGGRRDFLAAQITAVEAFLRRLTGEHLMLDREARLFYDLQPPVHGEAEFEASRARLEELLPGTGDLAGRVRALRDRFQVPADRLPQLIGACLRLTRERTRQHVELPPGEDFEISLVGDRPWSAYNWYQGRFVSRIEVNTDLPAELRPILETVAHEGYPGHHTYNALLEEHLVRARGWVEFSIYPLYSPQSLLAEGTANAGLSVILDEEEAWRWITGTLAPAAGLAAGGLDRYREVLAALRPLRYVRGEAARMLLDGGAAEESVIGFLMRYRMVDEARARKSLDFIRTYRSYVFNYTAGEDLVRAYLGDGPERVERFFGLLRRPATPSGLRRETEARR